MHRAFKTVEKLSGDSVKTYAWLPGATHMMPLVLKPASEVPLDTEAVQGVEARLATFKVTIGL